MINLSNSFIPILSALISIILLIGLAFVGEKLLKYTNLSNIISQVSNPYLQYPMIGSIFLSFAVYPIVIFNFFNNFIFLNIISIILILSGLINIVLLFNKKKLFQFKIEKNQKIESFLLILFFLGYFFLTLGPITDADSLDYHLGVPLYIINNIEYPAFKFWIHFTASGSGEILNTLGFFVKAEQFSSLIQYSAILSLGGVLLKKYGLAKNKIIYPLIIFSSPVLLFLIFGAKTQLNYVAASTLIFCLIFFGPSKNFKNFNFLLLINIFLMSAVNAKFSFALSSFLLWLYICYFCYISKNLKPFLIATFIIFCLTLLPRMIWRIDVYDLGIIHSLVNPLPTAIYGYEQLYESLSSCGYNGCWPYWLIFPKSIGTITDALGFGSLAILFLKFSKNRILYISISLILLQITLSKIFGQNYARWFLEPLIWIVLLLKYFGVRENIFSKMYFYIIKFQSVIVLTLIFYAVLTISIGSITYNLRDKVMSNSANGYDLFKWVNSKLKEDDVLISTHRSFALANGKTIPGDLLFYIDISNKKSIDHFLEIKELKPTHILFYDNKFNFKKLEKCLGPLLFYKLDAGKHASRNPLIRHTKTYPGFIYKFEYTKLPNCLNYG